jgi:hypothetical protein
MSLLRLACITAILAVVPSEPMFAQDFGRPAVIELTDGEHLARMRLAGLKGDRTAIPALIKALKNPTHQYDRHTAMRALAQLGATEALPAIEEVMRSATDASIRNFAQVIRARLVAEDSTKTIQDPVEQANAKTNRFMELLGTDVTRLNKSVSQQIEPLRSSLYPTIGTELYALRELADMVYRNRDLTLAEQLQGLNVRFDDDWASALKMRLAPRTSQQRVAWLKPRGLKSHKFAKSLLLALGGWIFFGFRAPEGLSTDRVGAAVIGILSMDLVSALQSWRTRRDAELLGMVWGPRLRPAHTYGRKLDHVWNLMVGSVAAAARATLFGAVNPLTWIAAMIVSSQVGHSLWGWGILGAGAYLVEEITVRAILGGKQAWM